MRLVLFLAVGFSIVNAITFLHVFHWFRRLVSGATDRMFREVAASGEPLSLRMATVGRLVRCHACTGFWVGVLLSWVYGGFIVAYVGSLSRFESMVADGFLLSGFSLAAWVILRRLGAEEL